MLNSVTHQLLNYVDLRIDNFLPASINARQFLRSLLKDSVNNIEAFPDLPLAACPLELHFFNLVTLFQVLLTLIADILSDQMDARLKKADQLE